MSRPLRIAVANGWYHVTARGNERKAIFRGDRDRAHFLELLGGLPERFGVRVAAYVLMGNHYHLIVQTPAANLSAAVQWLNVSYGIWFNRRHRRSGHLFQGRFRSILVEGAGAWLGELADYVHLNPVRVLAHGLGKAERQAEQKGLLPPPTREQVTARLTCLRTHRWSSYPAYAGYAPAPPWLDVGDILARVGGARGCGPRAYRERVEGAVRRGVSESPWTKLRAQAVLGTEAFFRSLRPKGDRREMAALRRMERRLEWAEVVRVVEQVQGERWAVFAGRYGDWGRDVALAVARRRCGLTLRELGERAGGMDYRAVSQAVRSLERRRHARRDLRTIWGKVNDEINMRISIPLKNSRGGLWPDGTAGFSQSCP